MQEIKLHTVSILTLLAILLGGCKESEIGNVKVMPNDFMKIDFSMSDIADDILIIPLSNELPLHRFQRVIWYDSHFYYLSSDKIARFTQEGKFVDVIHRKGRGPKEYLGIVDFFIDEETGNLFINTSDRLQVYDKNFNYLRTIQYPFSRNGMVYVRFLNGEIHFFYLNYENSGYSWAKTDTYGNLIEDCPIVDLFSLPYSDNEFQLFTNNNTLYRYYNRNDTIYRIDSNKITPFRIMDRDFRDGFCLAKESASTRLESKKQFRSIRSIFGLGEYWLMNYSKMDYSTGWSLENESVLYDPESNISYLASNSFSQRGTQNSIGLEFDWVGHGYFLPFNFLTIGSDKYLLRVYDSHEYLSIINDNSFQSSHPTRKDVKEKMIAVSETISIEDNPVIVLIKLKKTYTLKTGK